MSYATFLALLLYEVPETAPVLTEHLDDYDDDEGPLEHLFIADLRRLALAWFSEGRFNLLDRLLTLLALGLHQGDDSLNNAIALSFIEDLGWWDDEIQSFLQALPPVLLAEVKRQRDWRPEV